MRGEEGVQLGPQLGVVFEAQGRPEQEVVEVQGVGVAQPFFVDGVDPGHRLAEEIARLGGVLLGAQELVLGPADGRLDPLRSEADVVDVGCLQGRLDQPAAVVNIQPSERSLS